MTSTLYIVLTLSNKHYCLLKLISEFVSDTKTSFMGPGLCIKIELIYVFSENKLIELDNISCKIT